MNLNVVFGTMWGLIGIFAFFTGQWSLFFACILVVSLYIKVDRLEKGEW